MQTVGDMMVQLHTKLYGATREQRNKLATLMNTTTNQVVLSFEPKGLAVGSIVSIGDEDMYVEAVNEGTKTLTVDRADRGTVAAAHAAGERVFINTRFPQAERRRELMNEINSWSPDIFAYDFVTVSASAGNQLLYLDPPYDDALFILEIRLLPGASDAQTNLPELTELGFVHLDTAALDTRLAIDLASPLDANCQVQVALAYQHSTASFDDTTSLATLGITPTQADIAVFGAAARLLMGREIQRTDFQAQGEYRRAEEVPGGLTAQTATFLVRRTDALKAQEINRLRTLWPYRAK